MNLAVEPPRLASHIRRGVLATTAAAAMLTCLPAHAGIQVLGCTPELVNQATINCPGFDAGIGNDMSAVELRYSFLGIGFGDTGPFGDQLTLTAPAGFTHSPFVRLLFGNGRLSAPGEFGSASPQLLGSLGQSFPAFDIGVTRGFADASGFVGVTASVRYSFAPVGSVPEPGTGVAMLLGLGALGWRSRRRADDRALATARQR